MTQPTLNLNVKSLEENPIARRLSELAKQQFAHNLNQAGPAWCTSGYPWLRYLRAECFELMEHVGTFKHWKAANTDLMQARMELVDILIFGLSYAIEQKITVGCCLAADRAFYRAEREEENPLANINDLIDNVVESSYHGAIDWLSFARVCRQLKVSFTGLCELYEGKMALNHVRHANGYAAGTYLKTWFGQEDNQVVMEAILGSETVMTRIRRDGDSKVQENLRDYIQQLYQKAVEYQQEKETA